VYSFTLFTPLTRYVCGFEAFRVPLMLMCLTSFRLKRGEAKRKPKRDQNQVDRTAYKTVDT